MFTFGRNVRPRADERAESHGWWMRFMLSLMDLFLNKSQSIMKRCPLNFCNKNAGAKILSNEGHLVLMLPDKSEVESPAKQWATQPWENISQTWGWNRVEHSRSLRYWQTENQRAESPSSPSTLYIVHHHVFEPCKSILTRAAKR